MKVLIFGASGKTGHELVKQALAQGHKVTAFVRHPDKLKVSHANLKVVLGDIIHYSMVDQAVQGQDVVLSALGASSPFAFDQTIVDGTRHLLKAMESNGVGRFIYLSALGVKESRADGGFMTKSIAPRLIPNELKGHETREKIIQQSPLEWTIVRAATLTNGQLTGEYKSGETLKTKNIFCTISRADVAQFMLRQLTDPSFIRRLPRVMN